MNFAEPAERPAVADDLVKQIKQLIDEGQYDGVAFLFSSAMEAQRNLESLEKNCSDVLHEICLEHLSDRNYEQKLPLYNCAEKLLLLIAAHGPAEELLLELLEVVEEQKSDNVFTSALKALQVVLLRLVNQRPRALEWCLNSIQNRLAELPIPRCLRDGYDLKQQRLLEQDEQVLRVLTNYITAGLFYAPLLAKTKESEGRAGPFRSNQIDCLNVLCCFFVQLLGRPLALLDLSNPDSQHQTNTYTAQCATKLAKAVTDCIVDPLWLLSYVEKRVRWKPRLDPKKGVLEMSSHNIFMIEEKLPFVGLAVYYYMVLVEGVTAERVPQVYAPLYIFQAGLYLVVELLSQAEPALHYRGVLLLKKLLSQLHHELVPAVQLELPVHKVFCHELCNIVGYSPNIYIRQEGLQLLRVYILQFEDEGKYFIIKNLMHSIEHSGIVGYLAVIYKDLVAQALQCKANPAALPSFYSGADFRTILLQNICCLPQCVETDLVDQADKVIAALNAVRYFALTDRDNRTGFWNCIGEVDTQFLSPLRLGLDLSKAHYKKALESAEKGEDLSDETVEDFSLLEVNIANEAKEDEPNSALRSSCTQKVAMLNQNLCVLELIQSLLARATECVEYSARNCTERNA